tara:strand:- start:750 stop:1163 length:414 start_codon:yes stop_codon:yes gene_type:complete
VLKISTTERICEVSGCNNLGQHVGKYRKDGSIIRRAKCSKHHFMEYDLNGWSYKKYRLEYCENIDGRLGFKCTTTIIDTAYQLEVDHIDENNNNDNPKNLQTLCACCHRMKTKYYRTNDIKKLKFMNEQIKLRSYNG